MILEKYLIKAKKHGNTPVFSYEDSLKIIMECKTNHVTILGIDGFHITSTKTIPLQECSVDFTSSFSPLKGLTVWDESEKFIRGNPPDIYYEITIDD